MVEEIRQPATKWGCLETAQQASETAKAILAQIDQDRGKIEKLGRRAGSAHRLHQLLQRRPLLSVPLASEDLMLSAPTVRAAIEELEDRRIVREITGKQRDRIYVYDPYLKILGAGTEPL